MIATLQNLNATGLTANQAVLMALKILVENMTPDAFLAVVETVNEEVSELLFDMHHGKSAAVLIDGLLQETDIARRHLLKTEH